VRALIAGAGETPAELAAALRARGAEAEVSPPVAAGAERQVARLARALVEFERAAGGRGFELAVAVGTGDEAIALALDAAKLGIPLVACLPPEPGPDELERAEWRILRELAQERLPLEESGGAEALAERILAWAGAPG
jgi:hypothetical protein